MSHCMLHAHVFSSNSASKLINLFFNVLLVEIGVDAPPSNMNSGSTEKNTFPVMLHEEAMSTLAIDRDRMKGCKKCFSCVGSKKACTT